MPGSGPARARWAAPAAPAPRRGAARAPPRRARPTAMHRSSAPRAPRSPPSAHPPSGRSTAPRSRACRTPPAARPPAPSRAGGRPPRWRGWSARPARPAPWGRANVGNRRGLSKRLGRVDLSSVRYLGYESMSSESLVVRGAREHNLKNITVEIPRNALTVITGLSGSGQSSLAFDTLYAEGQRRYVESLSAYARQFLEQMEKPDCDGIEGLSPAIAIEQKGVGRNPRSTVGTVTEIADYLRLLFARVGHPVCYQCGREIAAQTVQQVVDRLMALAADTRLFLYAPVVRDRKGEHRVELDGLRRGGFVRVRVDGTLRELGEEIALAKGQRHTVEVLVDRLVVRPGIERRLADSLAVAFREGGGIVLPETGEPGGTAPPAPPFREAHACPVCGVSYPELSPRFFSFNSPHGACPACGGLGVQRRFDPALVVARPEKPLPAALAPAALRALPGFEATLPALAEQYRFRPAAPFARLPPPVRRSYSRGPA